MYFILNNNTTTDISKKLGIDLYVAQIIFEEAKNMRCCHPCCSFAINKDNYYNNICYLQLLSNEQNIIA